MHPAPAARIALDEAALASRLAAAVRFQTISTDDANVAPSGDAFDGLQRWLEASFPLLHATLARERVAEHALLYTWPGSDPALEPILLLAHQDVVPVEGLQRWHHPPFEGAVADGYVWGRGAIDDKASLVGICEAVEWLLGQGFRPERSVLLAFGDDEEVGGERGAGKIAELLARRGVHAAFSLDEGLAIVMPGVIPLLERPAALIGVAEKGYATLEVTADAAGGHSSTPPRHTAAGVLAREVTEIEDHRFPGRIGGVTAAFFAYLAPEMPLAARVPFANLWLFAKPLDWALSGDPAVNALLRTTTAVTMLSASPKENVLPARATATVNFRILPGETADAVLARVRSLIRSPHVEVRFESPPHDPSQVSPSDGAAFGLLQRTIGEVFPDAVVAPGLVLGGTDSRHYGAITANRYRFEPFQFDASDLKRPHGIDERIGVANYADGVRFFVRLIQNASGPGAGR
jgi:carboxypeptidase PM20D1